MHYLTIDDAAAWPLASPRKGHTVEHQLPYPIRKDQKALASRHYSRISRRAEAVLYKLQ